jgi:hypothetical protein
VTGVDRILAAIDAALDEPPARAFAGRVPPRTFTGRCPCWRCVVRRLPAAVADALCVARLLPGLWREIGRSR